MSGVADDYALSPYLWLEEGNTYQIDITTVTEASGNTAEINVVAGPSPDADLLAAIAGITTQPGETLESTVFINTPSGEEASVHALQSADANNPVAVAAGNGSICNRIFCHTPELQLNRRHFSHTGSKACKI